MSGGLLLMLCAPGFTALLTATRAARPATDAAVRASTADSAAAARAHYRSALRYHAQGRLDSAVATAQLAAQAFPTQSAYLALVALLAARRSDGVTLVGALERLARMEAGRDVAVDSAVLRMARGSANGATARVLARLLDASAPLPRSTVLATLQDSVLFPEGMDIDEHTGTLYVASVRDGVIVERR
ncbi:MAG TPA: hypothetical protein VE869_09235, partial [Gemmatimonas sp.]|nr:hypothetical protein [Gemmatimonas sp.]